MTQFFLRWLNNNLLKPGKNSDWPIKRRIVDVPAKFTFCERKNVYAIGDL